MINERYDPWKDDELLSEVLGKFENQQSAILRMVLRFRLFTKQAIWAISLQSTYVLKRLFDIFVSTFALVALSPIFLITWFAIRFEDPGTAIYVQKRVGKWGRHFDMYKFRSMVMNADGLKDKLLQKNESGAGVTFKMKSDPRITKVGKWIRKLSVDELPQLVNVLKGDMSLVGPRPPVPREVAEYTINQRRRLDVIPGITCLWQIGGRSDIDFDGQVRLDVQYIREQRLLKDVWILLKTIPAVLLGKGAY